MYCLSILPHVHSSRTSYVLQQYLLPRLKGIPTVMVWGVGCVGVGIVAVRTANRTLHVTTTMQPGSSPNPSPPVIAMATSTYMFATLCPCLKA